MEKLENVVILNLGNYDYLKNIERTFEDLKDLYSALGNENVVLRKALLKNTVNEYKLEISDNDEILEVGRKYYNFFQYVL